ncbi:MAG: metal-dependent hydrolase [Desulfuromonadales bacterium]|nr:metal-dependent hydrolase [Desulfuromonadales bacterium]
MKTFILGGLIFMLTLSTTSAVAAEKTSILWYGQSAFKITTPTGKVLLIDPWISNPANPNGKKDIENLKKVDLILITHGHGDHIGDAVEIAKKTGAKLVATFELQKALVAYMDFPAAQADMSTTGSFGGTITLLDGEVTVKFINAIHGGGMDTSNGPVYAGPPSGFLISIKNGPRIYHTGDTDLFSDMAQLKGKVDIMLVCIGDKFTMGPADAAQAVNLVQPVMAIPIHYKTFPALTGTAEAFKAELKKLNLEKTFKVLNVGESIEW